MTMFESMGGEDRVLTVDLDTTDAATVATMIATVMESDGANPLLKMGAMKLGLTIRAAVIEQIPGAREMAELIETEETEEPDPEKVEHAVESMMAGFESLLADAAPDDDPDPEEETNDHR